MRSPLVLIVAVTALFVIGCGQTTPTTPTTKFKTLDTKNPPAGSPNSSADDPASADAGAPDTSGKKTLFQSDEAIERLYIDKIVPGNLLLKLKSGDFQTVPGQKFTNDCAIKEDYYQHFEWASPFLVSTDQVCVLDEKTKTLRTVYQNTPIPESYSTAYFHRDQTHYYFAVNSRPRNGRGYIHLKKVPISVPDSVEKIPVKAMVDQIVPYSGPMSIDPSGDQVFYTGADYDQKNNISTAILFQFPIRTWLDLAFKSEDEKPIPFDDFTRNQKFTTYRGLSSWMSVGSHFLLYLEEKDPKTPKGYVFIDRATKKITRLKQNIAECWPEGMLRDQIILLCPKNEVASIQETEYLKSLSPKEDADEKN